MIAGKDVRLQLQVGIPMRDGVQLSATIYLPRAPAAPAPAVFALIPYIADLGHERGIYFASQGLPFVAVDVRGRGNSGGEFAPYIQEANDGYDVVEWLAAQPFCNGRVAMWGSSYLGYAQWATAKEHPPHLATIVPTAAPFMGIDFPMRNNIFYPYLVQYLSFVAGRALQPKLFADRAFWSGVFRKWHDSGRSFRELDTLSGRASAIYQEWLAHPEPDVYWDQYNPTAQQYSRLSLPVLTITGSYDDDQPGALEHYRQHLHLASPEARERHYLVIGPWDHYGTAIPRARFGGLTFGPDSVIDMLGLHRQWYAWTMQDGPRPAFLRKRVAYYVMGAEQWRYADSLDAVTARHAPFFLDSHDLSGHGASSLFRSGALQPEPGEGPPDVYRYDPRDTRGAEVAAEAAADGCSLVDQSVAYALDGRMFVYHSAPFTQDVEVCGFFRLSAWLSIDCPDTDFYVSVHEITSNGEAIRLSTDALRARYREGLRIAKRVTTDQPLRYEFERFTFVSRRIGCGHRLRLIIAPVGRLIESTFVQKNYNGGGVVAEEAAQHGRRVTVRLFHDAQRPSVLYVPVGQAGVP